MQFLIKYYWPKFINYITFTCSDPGGWVLTFPRRRVPVLSDSWHTSHRRRLIWSISCVRMTQMCDYLPSTPYGIHTSRNIGLFTKIHSSRYFRSVQYCLADCYQMQDHNVWDLITRSATKLISHKWRTTGALMKTSWWRQMYLKSLTLGLVNINIIMIIY